MQREITERRGFTVVELMIVISIIALLAAMAASALSNAAEQARAQRTRAIINKIDQLIMEKWDGFRTRSVPYRGVYNENVKVRAQNRLNAIREIQRMELPERRSDVINITNPTTLEAPVSGVATSSLLRAYFRKVYAWTGGNPANWTEQYQGAECLYLILSCMRDGDQSALEYFTASEIGDVDGDGMPEILDGWGRPIEFLRWAPGYTRESPVGTLTHQTIDASVAPDPFDPMKLEGAGNFALTPLIYSAGPDGEYEVNVNIRVSTSQPEDSPMRYTTTTPPNNPYLTDVDDSTILVGSVLDLDGDTHHGWTDNITNHYRGDQ